MASVLCKNRKLHYAFCACKTQSTQEQIDAVIKFELELEDIDGKLEWKDINNIEQPRSLFQAILRDKKTRVDEKNFMAGRPNFAVVSVEDGKVVRLEYYEGHDGLSLVYDLRCKKYKDVKLAPFMEDEKPW